MGSATLARVRRILALSMAIGAIAACASDAAGSSEEAGDPSYSGRWQTASTLLPSGSRTKAPK
jgi:hypothetical protein